MEPYKENIAAFLIKGYYGVSHYKLKILDKISDAIYYAWENWDDENVLQDFYDGTKGVKPVEPTDEFIQHWIDNEDFEADGFDENQLKEMFS